MLWIPAFAGMTVKTIGDDGATIARLSLERAGIRLKWTVIAPPFPVFRPLQPFAIALNSARSRDTPPAPAQT